MVLEGLKTTMLVGKRYLGLKSGLQPHLYLLRDSLTGPSLAQTQFLKLAGQLWSLGKVGSLTLIAVLSSPENSAKRWICKMI